MLRESMRPRLALVLLLVVALLLAGCGGGGDDDGQEASQGSETPPDEPVTIRMGWLPAPPGGEHVSLMTTNPELAPNLGTWYELEYTEFPGTPPVVQGLASGSVDVGTVGSLTVANGLDQGADLVLTGQLIQEHPEWGETVWLVRPDSGIESPADVAGKTVGVNSVGAYVDYVADYYLREEGDLEANRDYDKVEVPFPQQQEALESGQIDVGVFPASFALPALANGNVRLFGSGDVQEELIIVLEAFRREFVEENETAVRKYLEDYVAVTEWMLDPANRDQVVASYSETSGVPVEVADQWLITNEGDYFRTPDGSLDAELLQENWDFFREEGAFDAALEIEDHLVPQLWPSGQ